MARLSTRQSIPWNEAAYDADFYLNRAGKNLPASRKRVLQRAKDALPDLQRMMAGGYLNIREHILDGLEQAPGAIAMLYTGDNDGRLTIRI